MALAASSSTATWSPSSASWTSEPDQAICASGLIPARIWQLRAHKAGNDEDDYEDAFFVPDVGPALAPDCPDSTPAQHPRRSALRVAIADGATESSFAGEWARLLVGSFGRHQLSGSLSERSVARVASSWRREVGERRLPWYAQEKLESGAFSTFLGLSLWSRAAGAISWSASAIGDSCLFHMRNDRLVQVFPALSANDFGNTPYLLSSSSSNRTELQSHVVCARGAAWSGDSFFLATDALAAWFLSAAESDRRPWEELALLARHPGLFAEWLRIARNHHWIRNDDVTLVAIEIG